MKIGGLQKLTSFLVLICIMSFISFPLFIYADGGVIRRVPGTYDYDWVGQNRQRAFINYQNGIEKLIIGVDIEKEAEEVFWIIPIPSKPYEIKIDILSSLPCFYGEEVITKAKGSFRPIGSAISYPVVLPILLVTMGGARAGPGARISGDSVLVTAHLEKAGMIAEVLSAETDQALYDYLSEKGLKLERGAISIFNQYIGKDYSFVVSWISSGEPQQLISGERGIYIIFPTSEIYYPLLPTSAYGEKVIPITIRILGYVKPKLYSEIRPYLKTEYFTKMERGRGARIAVCKADVRQIAMALEMYASDYGTYPISLEELVPEYFPVLPKMEYCLSFDYQVSPDGKDFTLSGFLGAGEEYFISSQTGAQTREVPLPVELQDFYQDKEVWKGNSEYTKITIVAPTQRFIEDLWMKPGAPLAIYLASMVASFNISYSLIAGILYTAILSFLAGGISGFICFRKFKKYAMVGFSNIFTIIGLALTMIFVKKEEYTKTPKLAFVGLFFFIYLSFVIFINVIS